MTPPGALARIIRSSADRSAGRSEERCDLCGEPLAGTHRHLHDTDRAETLCACQACSLLFTEHDAGDARYLLVPRRRVRLPPVETAPLGVPVGLAFFVPRRDGTVTAHYPSPAGATRWEVEPDAWREAVARCTDLAGVAPEVEALLVNTARGLRHHWIVPVDDCFRLVALVRREWRGLSGGGRIWPAVEEFFAALTERSA
ncbi:conserved hypothetical protein [Streptomyces viridosporus ATCC 14672]|uniref:Uncharacterized protein n=1 Tax=Streptomyces viridosporus (strain ATCC 14672 / DSM 40746 / JCM 4963 / KCTC 9882 / NRRL B-12104 / FH 1290) TaxID=566461 RepID=D5ZZY2_STRV1|nr:DUF5947 family protein [Streptomyces viridosporus]EFE65375.1 conserved hypothetical protein [Streptomyces viridosporus ATCC 14672]